MNLEKGGKSLVVMRAFVSTATSEILSDRAAATIAAPL